MFEKSDPDAVFSELLVSFSSPSAFAPSFLLFQPLYVQFFHHLVWAPHIPFSLIFFSSCFPHPTGADSVRIFSLVFLVFSLVFSLSFAFGAFLPLYFAFFNTWFSLNFYPFRPILSLFSCSCHWKSCAIYHYCIVISCFSVLLHLC